METRTEFMSNSVPVLFRTREHAWLPPRKGRCGPKAFAALGTAGRGGVSRAGLRPPG